MRRGHALRRYHPKPFKFIDLITKEIFQPYRLLYTKMFYYQDSHEAVKLLFVKVSLLCIVMCTCLFIGLFGLQFSCPTLILGLADFIFLAQA